MIDPSINIKRNLLNLKSSPIMGKKIKLINFNFFKFLISRYFPHYIILYFVYHSPAIKK